jgi:putative Mn2+ efflux pump MntP
MVLTILAITALVLSRCLTNPVPRRMELIGAVVFAILVLFGLYLRYRGRRKNRHQEEEDESNPR